MHKYIHTQVKWVCLIHKDVRFAIVMESGQVLTTCLDEVVLKHPSFTTLKKSLTFYPLIVQRTMFGNFSGQRREEIILIW